jgi:hypothetical protein
MFPPKLSTHPKPVQAGNRSRQNLTARWATGTPGLGAGLHVDLSGVSAAAALEVSLAEATRARLAHHAAAAGSHGNNTLVGAQRVAPSHALPSTTTVPRLLKHGRQPACDHGLSTTVAHRRSDFHSVIRRGFHRFQHLDAVSSSSLTRCVLMSPTPQPSSASSPLARTRLSHRVLPHLSLAHASAIECFLTSRSLTPQPSSAPSPLALPRLCSAR